MKQLAPNQIEVIEMLAAGKTVRQIAHALRLRPCSVSMRLNRAARILGTETSTHTVAICVARGLITVPALEVRA